MGRGKLSLKLISSHKSRAATFHKRKKSLIKKAYELSTLCDVRTCVLINGPAPPQCGDSSALASELYTWPPSRDEVEGMIRAYKTNCRSTKCFDLFDFFSDRMMKVEAERSKIRNDAVEIEHLSEDQLRWFVDALSSKIEVAEGMIEFMEADYDHLLGEQASASDFIPLPSEGNSVQRMSIEEFDPSNLFGLDEAEFTHEHLHSLLNQLDNDMITSNF